MSRKVIVCGPENFGAAFVSVLRKRSELLNTDENTLFSADGNDSEKLKDLLSTLVRNSGSDKPENRKTELVILCDQMHSQSMRNVLEALAAAGLLQQSLVMGGVSVPMAVSAVSFLNDVDTLDELGSTLMAESSAAIQAVLPQSAEYESGSEN